ncbi:unnamed protein product [Miscanthus lutarioriparius]|uniref:Uncharacterized protein n=1 Tax=Miscanthus lutarioriparius TaxID=422564 RepID=A0A811PHX5_9POAL|nr:unnamed protein product [Miscanthus lutarioriparius]
MAVRLPLALAAMAAALLLLLCCGGGAEARVLLTLDDFGAVGDGIANDTQALLDAWTAACTSLEEAVLAVPVGKAYRIWPMQLSGPCKKKLKLLSGLRGGGGGCRSGLGRRGSSQRRFGGGDGHGGGEIAGVGVGVREKCRLPGAHWPGLRSPVLFLWALGCVVKGTTEMLWYMRALDS